MILTVLFAFLSSLIKFVVAVSADTCATFLPTAYHSDGFGYKFYTVPPDNTLEKVHDLLYYYSYSFVESLGSAGYEQSNIDIDINLPESDTPVIGEVYPGTGYNTTLSNFAATYGGIMVPPVTGEYKFSIDDVSDGAAIFVFTNRDMYCCEDLLFSNWINKTANFYYIQMIQITKPTLLPLI